VVLAATSGDLPIVAICRQRRERRRPQDPKTRHSWPPRAGRVEVALKPLVAGAKADAGCRGESALQVAPPSTMRLAKMPLASGASVRVADKHGETALARRARRLRRCGTTAAAAGAEVDAANKEGLTPDAR
jgi:hypothetical protein